MDISKVKVELTDKIIKILSNSQVPIQRKDIAQDLELNSHSPEYELMIDVLNKLIKDKVIHKSSRRRYSIRNLDVSKVVTGVLQIRNRNGILKTSKDSKHKGIIVKLDDFADAMLGDYVKVEVFKQKIKKSYGRVVEVIERNNTQLTGEIIYDNGYYMDIEEKNKFDFYPIDKDRLNGAEIGDRVVSKFKEWDYESNLPILFVQRIFREANSNLELYDRIVGEYNLPFRFENELIDEAESSEPPKSTKKYPDRLDLRKDIVMTIDPDDAQDYDDGLSIKILDNGNYSLGIHIADVSHYITENSAIDIEARERGNSTYLVDRVVPMIPEHLSNNLCSLMQNRVRFAYSVLLEIDDDLVIHDYQIRETLIKSKKRFTYSEALEIIEGKESKFSTEIRMLHQLSLKLRKNRFENGGINFETNEVRFQIDENKDIKKVELKMPNAATEMVEEMMLLANKIVANEFMVFGHRYKIGAKIPAVFRVHEEPDAKRLKETIDYISTFGKKFKNKDVQSSDINNIIQYFKDKPEKDIANKLMIKSMTKAYYDRQNLGHFGLGFDNYTHFTSPIRRYADLIVHRLLKEYAQSKPDEIRLENLKYITNDICKNISLTERNSIDAERKSKKLAHSIMMKDYVGKVFTGSVTGMLNFGLFIQLDELYAEGLMHVKTIPDDYYGFHEEKHSFIGEKTKKVIGIGDKLKVRVKEVDVQRKMIDFSFIDFV